MYYATRNSAQRAASDSASTSGRDHAHTAYCETQPPQRFSLHDVQASAGVPLRPVHQPHNQHPAMSRLHAVSNRDPSTAVTHTLLEEAHRLPYPLASQLLSQSYQHQVSHHTGIHNAVNMLLWKWKAATNVWELQVTPNCHIQKWLHMDPCAQHVTSCHTKVLLTVSCNHAMCTRTTSSSNCSVSRARSVLWHARKAGHGMTIC